MNCVVGDEHMKGHRGDHFPILNGPIQISEMSDLEKVTHLRRSTIFPAFLAPSGFSQSQDFSRCKQIF